MGVRKYRRGILLAIKGAGFIFQQAAEFQYDLGLCLYSLSDFGKYTGNPQRPNKTNGLFRNGLCFLH